MESLFIDLSVCLYSNSPTSKTTKRQRECGKTPKANNPMLQNSLMSEESITLGSLKNACPIKLTHTTHPLHLLYTNPCTHTPPSLFLSFSLPLSFSCSVAHLFKLLTWILFASPKPITPLKRQYQILLSFLSHFIFFFLYYYFYFMCIYIHIEEERERERVFCFYFAWELNNFFLGLFQSRPLPLPLS